jgi:hypothetical protein
MTRRPCDAAMLLKAGFDASMHIRATIRSRAITDAAWEDAAAALSVNARAEPARARHATFGPPVSWFTG